MTSPSLDAHCYESCLNVSHHLMELTMVVEITLNDLQKTSLSLGWLT